MEKSKVNIRFKTSILRSNICAYSDAYVFVKGKRSVASAENPESRNKMLTSKNNAPFRSRIWKINNTLIDNAEDVDTVMPMYNSLEYSNNFSMTSGNLRNYYSDKQNDFANKIDDNDNMINNNKPKTSKSFEYKSKIIGSPSNNDSRLKGEVVVPLKYVSNFWRSFDSSLINCEIELELGWVRNCIISEVWRTFREVNSNADPVEYEVATLTTGATF